MIDKTRLDRVSLIDDSYTEDSISSGCDYYISGVYYLFDKFLKDSTGRRDIYNINNVINDEEFGSILDDHLSNMIFSIYKDDVDMLERFDDGSDNEEDCYLFVSLASDYVLHRDSLKDKIADYSKVLDDYNRSLDNDSDKKAS